MEAGKFMFCLPPIRGHFLTSEHSRNGLRYRAVILLLASTLVLYVSTAAYWASIVANAASANTLLEDAAGRLLDPSHLSQAGRNHSRVLKQSIVATTSLAVNIGLCRHGSTCCGYVTLGSSLAAVGPACIYPVAYSVRSRPRVCACVR